MDRSNQKLKKYYINAEQQIPVPYGTLHIPPANLLLLAAKQDSYKKAHLSTKNIEVFRTRQKNKRGDSKVESNDSPEIPDRITTDRISDAFWLNRKKPTKKKKHQTKKQQRKKKQVSLRQLD